MSYTIHYHKEQKENTFWYRIQIPIAVLLIIMAVTNGIYHFTGNYSGVREQLMPWTQPEVKEAFSELTTNLTQGEPLVDSIEAFCREILHDETQEDTKHT